MFTVTSLRPDCLHLSKLKAASTSNKNPSFYTTSSYELNITCLEGLPGENICCLKRAHSTYKHSGVGTMIWAPCHSFDHELVCITNYSWGKCEATCFTAKAWPKWGHATGKWKQSNKSTRKWQKKNWCGATFRELCINEHWKPLWSQAVWDKIPPQQQSRADINDFDLLLLKEPLQAAELWVVFRFHSTAERPVKVWPHMNPKPQTNDR